MGMQNYKCKFHAFMVYDSELYACKLLELGSHRKIRNVSQPIVVGTHSPRYYTWPCVYMYYSTTDIKKAGMHAPMV